MFYLPWHLRDQTEFLSPKGPNFAWSIKKNIDISGTKISLKVPPNKTQLSIDKREPNSSYDLTQLQTSVYGVEGNEWKSLALIRRRWDFNGPWFTGSMGVVNLYAGIYSPKSAADGLNFFHPRALENGIANYLTLTHGNDFSVSGEQQSWFAPVNWHQHPNMPCIAARFDAVVNKNVYNDGLTSYLVFPLGKKHIFIADCIINRDNVFTDKVPKPTVDEWIDHKPFIELANQVLDSVQIALSPQAQAEQEEALRGLDDKSLIKEFPPLKWVKPVK